jgi:hypothetical protein
MSFWNKVKEACETFDTVVGGALLKTEQKLTGGLTFDEEAQYAAPIVGDAIKKAAQYTNEKAVQPAWDATKRAAKHTNDKAIQPVCGVAKNAYAKADEKATPLVDRAKAKAKAVVKKAREKKAAPAAQVTVVAKPDPNVVHASLPDSPATQAYEEERAQYMDEHSMLLNGLMIDATARCAWIAEQTGINQGTMTLVAR